MIYFRDYHWLPVEGHTRFDALINTEDRKKEDVFWMLDLRATAGGPEWRRVLSYKRPQLWLQISGFKPQQRDWTDLENLDFWNWQPDDDVFIGTSGALDVDSYPPCGSDKREHSFLNDAIWRVATRDGAFFTVELAAFADGRNILEQLLGRQVAVMPDGCEERVQPDAEFWKKHADLYFLETIPFGTISVRVPRNVRDAETFALRRARELVGVGEPEHIQVTDHLKANQRVRSTCPERISQDVYVELHFNGYFED